MPIKAMNVRQILAAVMLAEGKDVEYWVDPSDADFEPVVGFMMVGDIAKVYLLGNQSKKATSIEIVTLTKEEIDAVADRIGYLDIL